MFPYLLGPGTLEAPPILVDLARRVDARQREGKQNYLPSLQTIYTLPAAHVLQGVPEPKEEVKARYSKNEIRAIRILSDYIKDHLIPHV